MSLRNKLLLVALSMLVLPWAGWQWLRQMEALLRQGQEQALVASAEALARALAARPAGLPEQDAGLFVRALARPPTLDGRFDDWPDDALRSFRGRDEARLLLGLGRVEDALYLRIELSPPPAAVARRAQAHWPQAADSDHVRLDMDGSLGALALRIANTASGPLRVAAVDGSAPAMAIDGYWRDSAHGYAIELRLPQGFLPERLGVQGVVSDAAGTRLAVGTAGEAASAAWPLLRRDERLARPLLALLPRDMRARLIAAEGWVLAEAGDLPDGRPGETLPWWRRELYQLLLYAEDPWHVDDAEAVRSERPEVWQALSGVPGVAWRRERESPRLLLSAAVPVPGETGVRGAVLLEREHQTLSLTDRAVGGLLGGTLLALLAATGALLLFASRLSWRIGALRNAAETALESDGRLRAFPRSTAGDEIGDLSRSFARLLDEVAANQDYLRSLAGKLSHELNTPLAIVRGALDNIDAATLEPAARACVVRARGGSERLAAIVRAMSEASRLEQVIAAAEDEAEDIDLTRLLRDCAAGYAPLLAPRRLDLDLPDGSACLHGAPELIVQALDKLIDNARGFTAEDGWVRIALQRQGEGWRIAVANRGPTLPPALRHRLFESLVSQRPARGEGGVHLGFGLYLVRLVAELHRGRASAADLETGDGVEVALWLRDMPRRRR